MSRDDNATNQIDLRHHGCGGFYHSAWTMGFKNGFRCGKCDDEIWTAWTDDEEQARQDAEREAQRIAQAAEWAAMPPPEPPKPIRPASRFEALVLGAYREWSEDNYAASFLSPDDDRVISFIRSLDSTAVFEDYELDLLERYDAIAMPV